MTSNPTGFSKETTFDSGPLSIFGQKQLEDTSEIEWEKSFEPNRTTWARLILMLTSSTNPWRKSQNFKIFKQDNFWFRAASNFRSKTTWRYIRDWVGKKFWDESVHLGGTCIEVKYLAPKLQITDSSLFVDSNIVKTYFVYQIRVFMDSVELETILFALADIRSS